MHRLEKILLENGYIPNREDDFYSCVQECKLDKVYSKEKYWIRWGLSEVGYGPILIHPRPKYKDIKEVLKYMEEVKEETFLSFIVKFYESNG